MKLLFVSNLYGDNARGGAEAVVKAEAEALAALGHDVVVVSGEKKKKKRPAGVCVPGECAPGEPRLVRYRPPNIYFYSDGHKHNIILRSFWHLLDMYNGRSAAELGRILEQEKPDAVHTHNLMGLGFRIPALLRRRGIRHVHTVHDVQLLHPSGLLPPDGSVSAAIRPLQAAYVSRMRKLMGSPDIVIFPSEFLKELHVRNGFFPGSRFEVVRNPAPPVSLSARPVPAAPRFLFAGQLEKHKGIGFLLDVWEGWEDRGEARLEIAGAGAMEKEVRRRAKKIGGVEMLGKLDREGMFKALASNAFLVFPSLVIENAPATIMESLSRGTPVVASSVGGVPELVVEGQTGFLFRPGDAKECLAALRRASAQLPEWGRFFERCMRRAQEWSLDDHVGRLSPFYKKNPSP